MKYLQSITSLFGLNIEEPWLTAIIVLSIMFAIVGFINFLFRTITRGKEFFSSVVNIGLFFMVGIALYSLGVAQQAKKLEILVFETDKPYYLPTDEIFFHVKTNKQAFIYIYSYNKDENRILSFPNSSKNSNIIPANTLREVGGLHFSQTNSDFTHDQKVILVASTRPLHEAKRVMTPKSFSKMVEDSSDTKMYSIADKKEKSSYILNIPIHNNQIKIEIYMENIIARLTEAHYIDVRSSQNGYITVFEGVKNRLHRVEGSRVQSDEWFKTQVDSITSPVGEHIVVSIYTPQKEDITTNDFTVNTQEKKGGTEYSLSFKDKAYPYTIETFSVTK